MLIIFDLDDTLIDTSLYITPIQLKKALLAMAKEGLACPDFSLSFNELLFLDKQSDSASESLKKFIDIRGMSKRFFDIGLKEVYDNFSEDLPLKPVSETIQLLTQLKKEYRLALVSKGNPKYQLLKLKKAGIDTAFFYKILLLAEGSKKGFYEQLIQELHLEPQDVVVVGDRIPIDLLPAKELGCHTVHIKRGRGLRSQGEGADFTITELSELQDVLLKVKNKRICNRGYNG